MRVAYKRKYKGDGLAHTAIVEEVLGKKLPKGAVIHHVDHDGTNNEHSNLVVCSSHSYHMILHARESALDACGDPNKRKCKFCKEYDFPHNMYYNAVNRNRWHRSCRNTHDIELRRSMT